MEITFDSLFKDIFETTSDLIHFLSLDGNIAVVSPSWAATLGYSEDEVIGQPINNFIAPECKETYHAIRNEILLKGNHVNNQIEFTLVHKSGKLVHVEGQIGRVSTRGTVRYTRAILKNITAQKEREKLFIDNQERLARFFKYAPDAVIVINERQEITEWNLKAEKIFGYAASEVIGKYLGETIVPPQYREAHNQGMQHFLATGEGVVLNTTIEITALHKTGHEFFINLSISNIQMDNEWLFISFISDVTEKKKIQEELIHKEAQLLQSKQLDERKNNFLSYASHELKTPLTSMKGYLQIIDRIIDKEESPSPIRGFLQKANLQANKLTTLISDLLDVTKIESGKVTYHFAEVNLAEVIHDSVFYANNVSPSHQIIVSGQADFIVKADKSRLEQVITNLLSNAIKYSPQGKKVLLDVTRHRTEVTIKVTDFGIGIPADKKDLVFERFYRVDENSVEFSGLGLGLYISSEIIQRHNGKMWVESVAGKGSVFSFTIPL